MSEARKIVAADGNNFITNKFIPREFIIEPFLMTQGLAMIYAQRGIGKTFFALTLMAAMVKGVNLFNDRWKINKKWKVLYIDGEMSGHDMQDRLKSFKLSSDELKNISIINPDFQEPLGFTPNLATVEGQNLINDIVGGFDVIIVDNISTLVREISENQSNSWEMVQAWALKLRSQGKTIIFIHHANKSNSQRGTSRREDVLDTVISLKRPSEYNPIEGARFEVHFEKSRGFTGDAAEGFEVKLEINNGKSEWIVDKINSTESRRVDLILGLHEQGISQRKIAAQADCSLAKVNRIINQSKL
jgi:putative DNA primase/helicase